MRVILYATTRPWLAKLVGFFAFVATVFSATFLLQEDWVGGLACLFLALSLAMVHEVFHAKTRNYRKRCFLGAIGFGIVFLFFLLLIFL